MEKLLSAEVGVDAYCESLKNSLYVSMPGAVIAYYPGSAGKQATADIQPIVNDVRVDLDTNAIVPEPWSVIYGVPVAWPTFCGGAFTVCGFLQPGDQVLLEAFDLDPTAWLGGARGATSVTPADVRRLGGNYWRANPADLLGATGPGPNSPGIVIGQANGSAQISIAPGAINLGQTPTGFVAIAPLVAAELGKISKALSVLAAPSGGGPVTGNTYLAVGNVAASVVKAQ